MVQVRGRFLCLVSTDDSDVLFGNTFDWPLGLPWESGEALKFVRLFPHAPQCMLIVSRY